MNQYMVEFFLPENFDEEFISLIPDQRAQVGRLMSDRRMMSYALNSARTKIWSTIMAQSEKEVKEIIATLPLNRYMRAKISKLEFNENAISSLFQVSLN